MVSLVIVSHSKKIAEGIDELASQMLGEDKVITPVGGMEDGSIGTDVIRIKEAIINSNKGDGVVLMVDLGSGIMSGQMAMEMVQEEENIEVAIADAPIVEGSISAAIKAAAGGSVEEVVKAAESMRNEKKL
ncbi:MAG: dihydroxyacetone kinase phosphoryl donor subunit DhaM [Peptoniphilaceae bacterium]